MSLNETDIADAHRASILSLLAECVHTAMPGRVTAVNGDGTIDVKPLIKKTGIRGNQIEYPVLPSVTVLLNENSVLSVEMSVGDVVLLIFSEGSLENWTGENVANGSYHRKFSLADGFAMPLISSSGTFSLEALMTAAYKSAVLDVMIAALKVFLTGLNAGTLTAQASTLLAALNAIVEPTNSVTSKVKAA